MNIIDLQERLKDLPEQSLMQEMQSPSGTAPQFLVLSELKRRKRMRDDYQRQEAQGMQTVAEEAITAAGMPAQGIMQMSQAMAPQSAIAQNTGVNDMIQQDSVRAPQPEQPMMMAEGGYVQKMQEGSFTDSQRQGYLMFLDEMNLSDSPQSQEMYVRMMDRQRENPPSPSFFMPGIDRAPQALSDVSADIGAFMPADIGAFMPADIGAFMPGAEAAAPMMAAPPALGPAPSAGTIDFDASVTAAPAEYSLFPQDVQTKLDDLGFNPDYFSSLSEEDQQEVLGSEDTMQYLSDRFGIAAAAEDVPPEEEGAPRVSPGRGGTRQVVGAPSLYDLLASPGSVGGDPRSRRNADRRAAAEAARIAEQQAEFDILSRESAEEAAALRGRLGITDASGSIGAAISRGDTEEAARLADEARETVRRSSGLAGLSFGLGPADLPTTDTELSFGNITPSAADIPLSTGSEGTVEPTPEFPLGTPTKAPAASISDKTGSTGGGAGGFGPIESRIARMLEEREKSAQSDKWLALAQTGLALMASDQPTFGGAIGEAGLAGIGAMQQARSQYDKDIMGLLDMQAGVQRARASGARSTQPKARTPAELNAALDYLSGVAKSQATVTSVNDFGQEIETTDYSRVSPSVQTMIKQLEDQYLSMLQGGSVDLNLVQ